MGKGLLAHTDEPASKAEQTIKRAFIKCVLCREESGRENKTIHIDKRSVMGVCLLLLDYKQINGRASEQSIACICLRIHSFGL